MEEPRASKLRSASYKLAKEMSTDTCCQVSLYLYSNDQMSQTHHRQFTDPPAGTTQVATNTRMLEVIASRGNDAFDMLYESLLSSSQPHLAALLWLPIAGLGPEPSSEPPPPPMTFPSAYLHPAEYPGTGAAMQRAPGGGAGGGAGGGGSGPRGTPHAGNQYAMMPQMPQIFPITIPDPIINQHPQFVPQIQQSRRVEPIRQQREHSPLNSNTVIARQNRSEQEIAQQISSNEPRDRSPHSQLRETSPVHFQNRNNSNPPRGYQPMRQVVILPDEQQFVSNSHVLPQQRQQLQQRGGRSSSPEEEEVSSSSSSDSQVSRMTSSSVQPPAAAVQVPPYSYRVMDPPDQSYFTPHSPPKIEYDRTDYGGYRATGGGFDGIDCY